MKTTKQAVAFSRIITIDYYWRCASFKEGIPAKLAEALEETAMDRIREKAGEGYLSGELIDYVNMDIPGRKTPQDGWECHGWWNLKQDEAPSGKLNTVNVIECRGDIFGIQSLASFEDSKEGNILAEARFKAMINENGKVSNAVFKKALENGYFQDGEWTVLLTHSTEPTK